MRCILLCIFLAGCVSVIVTDMGYEKNAKECERTTCKNEQKEQTKTAKKNP